MPSDESFEWDEDIPEGDGCEMEGLYEVIEWVLHQIDMGDDTLMDDANYEFFCDLLERYDEGNRTVLLFDEMKSIYAFTNLRAV